MTEKNLPEFFPEFYFDALRSHAEKWANVHQENGVTFRSITLHRPSDRGDKKYLVLMDIDQVVARGGVWQAAIDAQIKQRYRMVNGIERPYPKDIMANMCLLEILAPYFEGPALIGLEHVYRNPREAGWQKDWAFEYLGDPPDFPEKPTHRCIGFTKSGEQEIVPVRAMPSECMWVLHGATGAAQEAGIQEIAPVETIHPVTAAGLKFLSIPGNENATLEQIAYSDEIQSCFPPDKMLEISTIIRIYLQGKVPVKRGRRKNT